MTLTFCFLSTCYDLDLLLATDENPYDDLDILFSARSICLMALTFAEKQKWVATLEAIVNHSGKEERINKAVSMTFTW